MYTESINQQNNGGVSRISGINNLRNELLSSVVAAVQQNEVLASQLSEFAESQAGSYLGHGVQLQAIQKGLQDTAGQLGVRFRLEVSQGGGALIRIFSAINNKEIATIPLRVIFPQLNKVQGASEPSDVQDSGLLI